MSARWLRVLAGLGAVLFVCGCQSIPKSQAGRQQDVILVLNGVDGSGIWYAGLVDGLGQRGGDVQMVKWGGPLLILPNLQLKSVHDAAQESLANRLREWRHDHRDGRVTLVGHSAGCGVILETLAASDPDVHVDTVLLLGPAVSAKYDLAPALKHVRGSVHVFYSEHDELLLKFGTSVAGTYDSVWGESAGLHGFTAADKLPEDLRAKLVQHPYDPAWKELGNGGGHFGWRSKPFVQKVLAPLTQAQVAPIQ